MCGLKLYIGSLQIHDVPAKWLGKKSKSKTNKQCLLVCGTNYIQFEDGFFVLYLYKWIVV